MSAERRPLWPPPLLAAQPRPQQVVSVVVGPIVTGAVCGWLLGESKVAYTVVTTLLIIAAVAAGYEHNTLRGGALRGLWIGALFGASIAVTHAIIGGDARADVPHPVILLAVLYGAISALLGLGGAALRRRRAP